MSEELLQTKPHKLDRYLYWKLGNSTLMQLKNARIIPVKQIPSKLASKRPDGLIVAQNSAIKAVIEYKKPDELNSQKKIKKAITQEIEVAKYLCKLLIVSDGEKSFWINTLTEEQITNKNGEKLKTFSAKKILNGQLSIEEIMQLEQLLDQIEHSLTKQNNSLTAPALIDPTMLAKTIWQKIWINTGKNPEQCLYNVVELFVFRFLSDVGVLKAHNNFDYVYNLKKSTSAMDALEHYARICRKKIRELFPSSPEDKTTILNGTIFVNEKGEPNSAQARLFGEVLEHLQQFTEKHGSFKNIQREFKTRLYESFLRQEAGVKSLGQYFTPRNVVRAMVDMSSASSLQPGARVCDPFCGVGGFVLETIIANPHIYKEFEPNNGIVSPRITLIGYDKGTDEKEDERTIILAKANMLIYFSDILSKYNSPEHLKAFSEGAFNSVFHLLRSNLGTFAKIDDEPYDLILTNPPYVTRGSNSLKCAIEEEGLSPYYNFGGRGTESLALEWIIRNLNLGGKALVIVPDGLLNQTTILKNLKEYCVIRAVISLPSRTFYSTPKKTYVLIITRKYRNKEPQIDPVFTYIVSEIGESRDAKRFQKDENNLDEATALYNQFKGSPRSFVSSSKRCKVISYEDFQKYPHWMVDRFWERAEKQ
ncbi:MAG: N-6 DNA methylase, partial [bacterium]